MDTLEDILNLTTEDLKEMGFKIAIKNRILKLSKEIKDGVVILMPAGTIKEVLKMKSQEKTIVNVYNTSN